MDPHMATPKGRIEIGRGLSLHPFTLVVGGLLAIIGFGGIVAILLLAP